MIFRIGVTSSKVEGLHPARDIFSRDRDTHMYCISSAGVAGMNHGGYEAWISGIYLSGFLPFNTRLFLLTFSSPSGKFQNERGEPQGSDP